MKVKIICFDIDNVICRTYNNDYKNSKPIKKNIKFINSLFSRGFYIKIFTARFMGRNNQNIIKAKKQGYKFTQNQLKKWGVKYNEIIFGKPSYDIFVDDKAYGFRKNWFQDLKKINNSI
jgi:CMP-N,N'-diacetyllegionaminic acid synthase